MRSRNGRAMLWLSTCLLLFICSVHADDPKPKFSHTKLSNVLHDLQYFDDSQVVVALVEGESLFDFRTALRSQDGGAKWEKVDDLPENGVLSFIKHPYDNKRAYAIGTTNIHWYTKDRGESWSKFDIGDHFLVDIPQPFSFHGTNADLVVMNTMECDANHCTEHAKYTTDGFKKLKSLGADKFDCMFAHSTPLERNEGEHENRILCLMRDRDDAGHLRKGNERLIYSDDYFEKTTEPKMGSNKKSSVAGIIKLADVKGYIVAAQKSDKTEEVNLWVSLDGEVWKKAQFPSDHRIEAQAYTMLESTNYSIQLNVLTDASYRDYQRGATMGTQFTSDSEGEYFSKNVEFVNRDSDGFVDFEKVEGIQGIYLVNLVSNPQEVHDGDPRERAKKKLKSKITFDDGRKFGPLKVIDDNSDKELHVHSVTEPSNIGRIFSSKAPGIVLAIGNTGEYLKGYEDGNLYVSDDAGLTWRLALEGPHQYEVGDQGSIIVAMKYNELTKEILYNTRHGQGDWDKIELDEEVKAEALTTIPDVTSLKFLLVAKTKRNEIRIYSIDFDKVRDKCSSDAFEDWTARKDEDGKADCIMGHEQHYRRRKSDANCFVLKLYDEENVDNSKLCECKKEDDFECAVGFVKNDDGDCKLDAAYAASRKECKEDKATFKAAAYRKIPGNKCEHGYKPDEDEKEWECGEVAKPPSEDKDSLEVTQYSFDKKERFRQKVWLEKVETSVGKDAVFVLMSNGKVYRTTDSGKNWDAIKFPNDDKITLMIPHQYNNDKIFFITKGKTVHYLAERGGTVHSFEAKGDPVDPDKVLFYPLAFHPEEVASFIWTAYGEGKELISYYSSDHGASWKKLVEDCGRCEYVLPEGHRKLDNLIYCEKIQRSKDGEPKALISSRTFFDNETTHFTDIVGFATMADYIVVANKGKDDTLTLDASVNAETFAEAKFPKGFEVGHDTTYTVLDSSTKAIFLEVTESSVENFGYGRIMKSNSNGTSYVLSIANVSRGNKGFIDFEKMQGIEGVATVNIVDNISDKDNEDSKKRLRTKITHNDGADWAFIKNVKDDEGKEFEGCSQDPECSLHLHGYTERPDPADTYSSPSAVGLMIGTGNVGKHLLYGKDEVNTFLTDDAGVNWKLIQKGNHMWEYGDQGGIIVLVKDGSIGRKEASPTDKVLYSTDRGRTWKDHKFSDSPVTIFDLTTAPSDNSPSFILWGVNEKNEPLIWNLDFSGMWDRVCEIPDEENDEEGDYEIFEPKHPDSSSCLFGHRRFYHRKKIDADCWNGRGVTERHRANETDCPCSQADYECEYNYERGPDKVCRLAAGVSLPDPLQQCKDDLSRKTYFESKGYRKIPLDTCIESADDRHYHGEEKACPNFREEFEKSHRGLSGFPFFLVAIVLPFTVAGGIGYYIWKTWDGKFGQIRLGEGGSSAFDINQPWIKYPVVALSGLVAVLAATPLLIGAAWRSVRTMFGGARRYTTRDSFARGRGSYAVIDPDEDELLGSIDDDEL